MKLIAFILDVTSIRRILSHLVEEIEPPQMHPARGRPNEFYMQECEATEYQYDQTLSERRRIFRCEFFSMIRGLLQ